MVVVFLVAVVVINLSFVVLPASELRSLLTDPAGRQPRGQKHAASARKPMPARGEAAGRPVSKPITLRSVSSTSVTARKAA